MNELLRDGSGDGIIGRAVGPICKLEGVQGGGEDRLDVLHDYPFKALHDDRSKCYWKVVIEAGWK